MALFVHDAQGPWARWEDIGGQRVAGATLGSVFLIAAGAQVVIYLCGRRLDRTGRVRLVGIAERTMLGARVLGVMAVGAAILGLGWLDLVRSVTGDLIFVDEALAVAPGLFVFVAGWWSMYPIERRLHEATLMRKLHTGESLHPTPTRRVFVVDRIRHQALLIVVPITLIMGWSEWTQGLYSWFEKRMGATEEWAGALVTAVQLGGVAVIFVLAAPMIRLMWSTRSLGAGELRAGLTEMCATHGVKFRDILVWRTHGTMINGAVIGVFGWLRYVLLTDALLDAMSREHVEAVMAHEIGHVRRRHLPWLLAALMAGLGLAAAAIAFPIELAIEASGATRGGAWDEAGQLGALVGAVASGLILFGFVSRRFERQADAFAVQHLSGATRENRGEGVTMTEEAARAMAGSLQAVADLNHISPGRFTWRHGSIRQRQRAILSLIGVASDAAPIDRQVRWIKRGAGVALAVLMGLVVVEMTVG